MQKQKSVIYINIRKSKMQKKEYPIFIKIDEVKRITTMSNSSIWRLIGKEEFPAPYKIAPRSNVWDKEEVYKHIYDGKLVPGNKTKH